jgi:uncharacterized protein involved in outer membrane biogenesis
MLGAVTHRRRLLWLALALVTVVALAGAAAMLNLSALLRQVAVRQLAATTGRPVRIDALDLSLRTGRFSVRGVRIDDHDGGVLAALERLDGGLRWRPLLRGHLAIDDLTLAGGHVRIVRVGPDRFNVSDLLERPGGPRFLEVSVDHLSIVGGRVSLEDRTLTPARTWSSDDIRLDARNVTTLERRGTAVGSTTIAGSLVTVRVDELQLAPVHLRAWVNVRDLDLRLVALYLPAGGPVRLERGSIDAAVTVLVDHAGGTALDADAVVERLALRRPGLDGDAVAAPSLRILVRDLRRRPGAVTLRYASAEGDVSVLDPTATPPRRLTFAGLTVTASGLEQSMQSLAQVAVHATLPDGGGEVDVGGTVGVTPRRADLRIRARGVALAALARYLPLEGRLTGIGRGDLRLVATHADALALAVTGDARVDRPAIDDGSRTLAAASRVAVTGLAYTWPATVRVDTVTVSEPSATLERDAAGAIGLAALLRPPGPPAAGAAAGGRPAADVAVARLRVDNGRALVTDEASGVRLDVRGIALTADDVAWPARRPGRIRASATVDGMQLRAEGTLDAGQPRAEVDVQVRDADLARLQPWLPIAGRVRGVADADVRLSAAHDGQLRLTVSGDTTLRRLAVLDGSRPVASAVSVSAGGAEYTWPASVRIARLTVTGPSATVERDAAGAVNLATLLRPAAPAVAGVAVADSPSEGQPLDVTVGQLRIQDGRALVADAGTGGRVEVSRLVLRARDVAWPSRGDAPVRLSATVGGGAVTARGTVDAGQRRASLAVQVRQADLTVLQPWLPIVGRLQGAADADVTVAGTLDPLTLTLSGSLGASRLAFLDGTGPVLTVARVDATGVDAQWPTRLTVGRLRVSEPWAKIERDPTGQLSLRALFARRPGLPRPAEPAPEQAAAPGPVPGLQVTVRDALFENGSTSIVDDAVEPAARLEVRGSRLALRDLTWPARGPAVVQLSTPMPGRSGGTLRARGTFSIEPTRLALEVDLDQVDLAPGRPYLPVDARLGGRLSGRAKVTGTFGDTIRLAIDGDAAVERLALGDDDRRLATARRAEVTGVRYRFPTSVRVRQVTLDKPWLLLERNTDGTLELVSLFRARTPPPPATGASPAGEGRARGREPRVRVLVDTLTLNDGFVRFVDRTTEPDYAEEVSGIALTAQGLGTRPSRRGKLTLRGAFASGTPLSVHGEMGGLMGPRLLDLTVQVRDFPVARLNPYVDHFLAWVARAGTLTATVRYRLNGDDLDAANDITLAGLEVERAGQGGEVQRRVGPPLDTLVSLLKNRDGVITLDLPVHGRLSAPEFHYGDAVWAAFRNLVIRLVALPFSLVGKLFFTEDSRIEAVAVDPVTFETGRATPTPAGAQQLDQLAAFLEGAPAIRLRLRPVTTVADVRVLRREALHSRLAALGADADARRRAAVDLYAELFPRRQPPPSDEALLEELTRETPTPPRALRALATDRVAATREALVRAGIAPERLEPLESRTAVESEGASRVEFEITH